MPKGVFERTAEYRAIRSKAMKGRTLSAEHRAKIGATLTGKKHSTQQRENESAARMGHETSEATRARIAAAHTVHGRSRNGDPTYRSWQAMRRRCHNSNANNYAHYGGKGIEVCERWDNFGNFLADMGERPDGYTNSRIDHDGNYEPANCEWARNGSH